MKILCAGPWKTGTKSLSAALRHLGYKVYDFDEQFLYFMDEWEDLFYRDTVPDFRRMFGNVDALVDTPANVFFEEILEAFPDARVILTVRDEESWTASLTNHIKVSLGSSIGKIGLLSPTMRRFVSIRRACYNALVGSCDPNATFIHRQRFRCHNSRVKAVVPPEQLLVYDVKEGWEPLCEFLGKGIPKNVPFPHLNRKGEVVNTFQKETEFGRKIVLELQRSVLLFLTISVAVVCVLVYALC